MNRTSTSLVLSGSVSICQCRADVPAEHDPVRRFVGEHPRPAALAAVDGAVVDVAADPRLEDGLGDRRAEQVVLRRLEVAEPAGEHGERLLDRCVDDDLPADHLRPLPGS